MAVVLNPQELLDNYLPWNFSDTREFFGWDYAGIVVFSSSSYEIIMDCSLNNFQPAKPLGLTESSIIESQLYLAAFKLSKKGSLSLCVDLFSEQPSSEG